jgi:hypothetical protein
VCQMAHQNLIDDRIPAIWAWARRRPDRQMAHQSPDNPKPATFVITGARSGGQGSVRQQPPRVCVAARLPPLQSAATSTDVCVLCAPPWRPGQQAGAALVTVEHLRPSDPSLPLLSHMVGGWCCHQYTWTFVYHSGSACVYGSVYGSIVLSLGTSDMSHSDDPKSSETMSRQRHITMILATFHKRHVRRVLFTTSCTARSSSFCTVHPAPPCLVQ